MSMSVCYVRNPDKLQEGHKLVSFLLQKYFGNPDMKIQECSCSNLYVRNIRTQLFVLVIILAISARPYPWTYYHHHRHIDTDTAGSRALWAQYHSTTPEQRVMRTDGAYTTARACAARHFYIKRGMGPRPFSSSSRVRHTVLAVGGGWAGLAYLVHDQRGKHCVAVHDDSAST